ncbi:MAG: hypothetical protein WA840_20015 [Caulobacteraceae bacterium]
MAHPFFWAIVGAHVTVGVLALAFGKSPERLAAAVMLYGLLLQRAIIFTLRAQGIRPSYYAATIDIAVNFFISTSFLGIALRFPNAWLIAALLIQSAELALNGLFLEDDAGREVLVVAPHAYNVLSAGLLALIALVALGSGFQRWSRAVRSPKAGALVFDPAI